MAELDPSASRPATRALHLERTLKAATADDPAEGELVGAAA